MSSFRRLAETSLEASLEPDPAVADGGGGDLELVSGEGGVGDASVRVLRRLTLSEASTDGGSDFFPADLSLVDFLSDDLVGSLGLLDTSTGSALFGLLDLLS